MGELGVTTNALLPFSPATWVATNRPERSLVSNCREPMGRRPYLLPLGMPKLLKLCVTVGLLSWASAASAQNPEAGRVDRRGDQAVLIVDGARPLDSAAITLAQEFGIAVSVEDPPYVFRDDIKDVPAEVARTPNQRQRVLAPKGGRLEVRFALNSDGLPRDLPGLLRDLVAAANTQFPFAYRVDRAGARFTLVPTRTRDALGQVTEIMSLMDRRVTIPPGVRSIAESARLMAEALSAQTGRRVDCCQAYVAGIPWGMAEIAFQATDEPARNVLTRLIAAASPDRSDRVHWLQRFCASSTCCLRTVPSLRKTADFDRRYSRDS